MVMSKVILLSLSVAFASAGFSQYYITPHFASHFSPAAPVVHQQISQNSIFDVPSFYHTQPLLVSHNINPFVHQSFVPSVPQVNVEQARSSSQTSGRSTDNFQPQGSEYGFGYRTMFDDGATSTVVFVSGPEAKSMSFLRNNKFTARKLASDIFDAKSTDEKNDQIGQALSDSIGLNFDALIEAYPDFKPLEQQSNSIVHLFSHPANVFPLATPTQTTTSSPDTTPVSSEVASDDDSESVAIESADSNEPLARSNDSSEKEAESNIQETKIKAEGSTESTTQASGTSDEAMESTTSESKEQESTTQQ